MQDTWISRRSGGDANKHFFFTEWTWQKGNNSYHPWDDNDTSISQVKDGSIGLREWYFIGTPSSTDLHRLIWNLIIHVPYYNYTFDTQLIMIVWKINYMKNTKLWLINNCFYALSVGNFESVIKIWGMHTFKTHPFKNITIYACIFTLKQLLQLPAWEIRWFLYTRNLGTFFGNISKMHFRHYP